MPDLPAPGDVHVWSIDLDRTAEEVAVLGGMLTADELVRAGQLRAGRDARRRFVASRAGLRALLGAYLGEGPTEVGFTAGAHGKPRLEPGSPLRFNLSHSADRAMVAVASEVEVGADVEQVRPRTDLTRVARRVFTEAERDAIEAAGAEGRDRAFYRHWVAKEAFVKATGRGISSLRSFEVLLEAPGGARLVHVGGDIHEAARWTLTPLEPRDSGYEAAVVAEGPAATIRAPADFDPLAPR